MNAAQQRIIVLSLYPFARGVAFAVFESLLSAVDWGVKDVRGNQKNIGTFEITKRLISHWAPDAVILAELSGAYGRGTRLRSLRHLIKDHLKAESIAVRSFTRSEVQNCFQAMGARTRYEIAQVIASRIAAFERHLPPVPTLWANQHARLTLFDAAALAMTFYTQNGQSLVEPDRLDRASGKLNSGDEFFDNERMRRAT